MKKSKHNLKKIVEEELRRRTITVYATKSTWDSFKVFLKFIMKVPSSEYLSAHIRAMSDFFDKENNKTAKK